MLTRLNITSQENGKYPYNVGSVPFLSEFTKLCFSAFMLSKALRSGERVNMTTQTSSILLFPIPSIIYVVHNNVQFYIMNYVDAATYQILGNLKIVTTGVLFYLFLNKPLSKPQWMAIVLLTVGATMSQVKGCGDSVFSWPIQGYLFGILSAFLSAFAGIYTEFLLKKNNDNLYWQNVQLYGFGALFNMLRLMYDFGPLSFLSELTRGFNYVVWLIIANFAFAGLMISWIQKYADSILKVYATSSAMFITAVISIALFGLEPSLQLFLGIITATISLLLYYLPLAPASAAPVVTVRSREKIVGGGSSSSLDEETGKKNSED